MSNGPLPFRENVSSLRLPLLGAILGGAGYGIASTLFYMCSYLLVKLARRPESMQKRGYALVGFVVAVWVSITVTFVSDIVTIWEYLGNPEGNPEFLFSAIGYPGLWGVCINNWLVDGLLVWRSLVILKNQGFPHILLGMLPVFLLLAVVGTTIPQLAKMFVPSIILAQLYSTIALNVTVTAIISTYLYLHYRRFVKHLSKSYSSQLTDIISMLVESAALVVAFDLLFIIPFALNNRFDNLPLQLLAYAQAIAAFLTIFRVAQGKAWVQYDSTEGRSNSFINRPSGSVEIELSE